MQEKEVLHRGVKIYQNEDGTLPDKMDTKSGEKVNLFSAIQRPNLGSSGAQL